MNAPSVADSSIGFHCQQAAEKLLKALLSQKEIRFQKTHDLQELMTLLVKAGSPLPESLSRVDEWTPYAVEWRYDYLMEGEPFNRNEARDLIRKLRVFVESQINPRSS
ncbi:MAG: HEPN domain-containing protein [Verrucomicrobia bacterium]|nr:HEPN domain-containing protein [Verrucomicrobiota bacterium]